MIQKIPKLIWPLLAVSLLILGVYSLVKIAPRFLGELIPKKITANLAPDFTLATLDGSIVKLRDLRGQKVILNFWTSWNEFSLNQIDVLESFYKSAQKDNLAILAINSQEDLETIKTALGNKDFNLSMLVDESGEVGELYNISTLPLTIFINKAGFIVNESLGVINFEQINNLVKKL